MIYFLIECSFHEISNVHFGGSPHGQKAFKWMLSVSGHLWNLEICIFPGFDPSCAHVVLVLNPRGPALWMVRIENLHCPLESRDLHFSGI